MTASLACAAAAQAVLAAATYGSALAGATEATVFQFGSVTSAA